MPNTKKVTRIAMWSGPRNISTALMRAWENRADTLVMDEPLYGQYLQHTQIPHPGADEVIQAQGSDWRQAVSRCLEQRPTGQSIVYQKHMTMHLLDHIERDWLSELSHCFLIRHPAQVLASYQAVREIATLEDIGFKQQAQLYADINALTGRPSLVIDAKDFLQNPKQMLITLCAALHVPFDSNMLQWPAGPRESDGVWSKYWYGSVNKSTGFAPYAEKELKLDSRAEEIVARAMPYYQQLYKNRTAVS